MKAWAMTERQASMWSVLSMSNTNWGFFRMFTQNRRGKLETERKKKKRWFKVSSRVPTEELHPGIKASHLLVFQMCRVSGSVMPRLSACSSRKSKKYLTARGGRSSGMLRMAWKRSSKNFWRVPWGWRGENGGQTWAGRRHHETWTRLLQSFTEDLLTNIIWSKQFPPHQKNF